MIVRALVPAEVDAYLEHVSEVDADSGIDGAGHSHPYQRDEPRDLAEAHAREITRWTTPIHEPGWRRAWGLFDAEQLVGHLYLAGGALRSELHRASLGMGIAATHHRRGGGSLLLTTAISWARAQPGLAWIDLGVFHDNPGAQALYTRHGFQITGHTPDRFRVDGVSLDDTSMTLRVTD